MEKAFTRDNAKHIELLYKYKAENNQARGLSALTSPMVNGNLITYLGFKEMLVFGGSSDNVYRSHALSAVSRCLSRSRPFSDGAVVADSGTVIPARPDVQFSPANPVEH